MQKPADPKAALKQFGANVRRLRMKAGLTQEQLADSAELNPRTVQKIEAGELNILLTTLLRLQRVLRCEWRDLMRD